MAQDAAPTIYVVSDSRGRTGAAVLQAALVQFEGASCTVVREADVRTVERVAAIVADAARTNGVVLYTLVAEETRRAMRELAERFGVAAVDVLGPALHALHDRLGRAPRREPGLLYASERESFDRHEAIDYTLKHDDGRDPAGWAQADVVLVGVSRAAKSSTCFYLAYEGVKAANVPLLPGVPPPPELVALPPGRVIGLWVNASRLIAMREARARHLGIGAHHGEYTDLDAVNDEVRRVRRLMNERGWRTLDVSFLAVEEVAREVMRLRGLSERSLG